MVKIFKMDTITSEIMLRKGLHLSLHGGEQGKTAQVCQSEAEFWEYDVPTEFWKGIIFINAECCREVKETKY